MTGKKKFARPRIFFFFFSFALGPHFPPTLGSSMEVVDGLNTGPDLRLDDRRCNPASSAVSSMGPWFTCLGLWEIGELRAATSRKNRP